MSSSKIHNKVSIIAIVFAVLFTVPGVALAGSALDLQYYTYGGFSDTVDAFTKLALIQSSAGIKTITAAIWIGMFGWALATVTYKRLTIVGMEEGEATPYKGSYPSAIIGSLFGAMLYVGLVLPTGTLHFYDTTENQAQAVGGIPFIVVAAAGAINSVEKNLVDLVDTAGDPQDFSKQGGGRGFMVLNSLMLRAGEPTSTDTLLMSSLGNYVNDCVGYEITRPGTTLTAAELTNGTDSFLTSLAKAYNPYVYTTIADDKTGTAGTSMSCTDAWANLSARLASAPSGGFELRKKRACSDAGYDVNAIDSNIADRAYLACTTNANSLIQSMDSNWSLNKFIIESSAGYQIAIAFTNIDQSLAKGLPAATTYVSSLNQFMSSLANKRGQLVAVATVGLPFILIFLSTRLWPVAVKLATSVYLISAIWGILMAIVWDFYITHAVNAWTPLLSDSNLGTLTQSYFQSGLVSQMNWWGIYLAGTFSLAIAISSKLGGFASAAATGANMAPMLELGDLSRGRLGVETQERIRNATAEGMAAEHFKKVDTLAAAQTGISGMDRLGYQTQTGAGQTHGQRDVLNSGQAYSAGAGAVTQSAVQNSSGYQAINANGGINNAVSAESFAKSADLAKKAELAAGFNGDFKDYAKQSAANDMAIKKTFGTGENYQAFLEAQHGKSAGEMAGAMSVYSQVKEQIRSQKGDSAADAYTWKEHNAIQSEVRSGKSFADSAALRDTAQKLGISPLQLSTIESSVDQSKAGYKAVTTSGGTTVSKDDARAIYQKLETAVQPSGTAQKQTKQAMQSLQQNLQSGNITAIQKDAAQSAAFQALTGNSAADVAKMDKQQQQQTMQKAEQTLQPTQQQSPEQKQAVQKAEESASTALGNQEHERVAAIAKEFGVNPESLQHSADNLKNTPPSAGREEAFVASASSSNGGLRKLPDAIAATGAVVGARLGTIQGSQDRGTAKADVTPKELEDASKHKLESTVGEDKALQNVMQVYGMDAKSAAEFKATHQGLDTMSKLQNFEASSRLLGDSIKNGDYKALAKSYGQANGSMDRILTAKEAKALNTQMHQSGNSHFNAKAGDHVQFGYNASTNKITMAHSTGGGQSNRYNLNTSDDGTKKWSGSSVVREDTNKTVEDKKDVFKFGSSTEKGYEFRGTYKDKNGNFMTGAYSYVKNPEGGFTIVGGHAENVFTTTASASMVTPDGVPFTGVQTNTLGQNLEVVHSDTTGGKTVTVSNKKSFSGGYQYDNFISAKVGELGYERYSQASGRVKGLFTDVAGYIAPVKAMTTGGNSPGGTPGSLEKTSSGKAMNQQMNEWKEYFGKAGLMK